MRCWKRKKSRSGQREKPPRVMMKKIIKSELREGVPTGAPLLCVQEQPEAKTQKG